MTMTRCHINSDNKYLLYMEIDMYVRFCELRLNFIESDVYEKLCHI
jgi:hypothetical protein